MTNHDWADNAAQCAFARANQHDWGTPRYKREFETFVYLAALAWHWRKHPPHLGGQP